MTITLLKDWGHYGDWYVLPPYAGGGGRRFGEQPTITVTEFYVTPFDRMLWNDEENSQASELNPGQIIGFSITIRDNDEPDEFTILDLPSLEAVISADAFVDGLLLGLDGEISQVKDTAVESDSWGRIKASFNKEIP